jgi:proline iminopeptidase
LRFRHDGDRADDQRVADPRPALRSVSTPVVVMRGRCDQIAWKVTREYRDLLPHAVLITIPDAGHEIPSDRPSLYDTAVRAFLLNQPLPRPRHTAETPPW